MQTATGCACEVTTCFRFLSAAAAVRSSGKEGGSCGERQEVLAQVIRQRGPPCHMFGGRLPLFLPTPSMIQLSCHCRERHTWPRKGEKGGGKGLPQHLDERNALYIFGQCLCTPSLPHFRATLRFHGETPPAKYGRFSYGISHVRAKFLAILAIRFPVTKHRFSGNTAAAGKASFSHSHSHPAQGPHYSMEAQPLPTPLPSSRGIGNRAQRGNEVLW